MSHNRIRTFNKHITNPLLHTFASCSRGPFAIIRHVGRRSGKPYETTIMIWPMGDGFVIALTYGESVDWYRNILAAGHCTLLWHGRVYAVGKPEPIDVETALPAFPLAFRPILRRRGVPFVRVKSAAPEISQDLMLFKPDKEAVHGCSENAHFHDPGSGDGGALRGRFFEAISCEFERGDTIVFQAEQARTALILQSRYPTR